MLVILMIEGLEKRYLVLKLSDIEKHLSLEKKAELIKISDEIDAGRLIAKKQILDCLVIERDWPEYGHFAYKLLDIVAYETANKDVPWEALERY